MMHGLPGKKDMLFTVYHAPLIARLLNQLGHLGHVACKRKKRNVYTFTCKNLTERNNLQD